MGKSFQHTTEWPSILGVKTNAPLDTRQVVQTVADLTSAFTDTTVYNTMVVGVEAESSVYVLTNKNNWKTASAWKKLASDSDVSSLSGVFTFKGIAEAVSPDLSYIVTCQEYEGDALSPIGTAADFEGDVYYGWQINGEQIWTDSLVLNSASIQYTRGEKEVVKCVVYNDIYYFTTEFLDEDKTILESISGHQIKVRTSELEATALDRLDVYDGEIIGDGYILEYTAYSFTLIDDSDTVSVYHSHTIIYASDGTKVVDDTTIPDNSGHVYQIGENEYASNGQIWVKLGSPVEDWIVIE